MAWESKNWFGLPKENEIANGKALERLADASA